MNFPNPPGSPSPLPDDGLLRRINNAIRDCRIVGSPGSLSVAEMLEDVSTEIRVLRQKNQEAMQDIRHIEFHASIALRDLMGDQE